MCILCVGVLDEFRPGFVNNFTLLKCHTLFALKLKFSDNFWQFSLFCIESSPSDIILITTGYLLHSYLPFRYSNGNWLLDLIFLTYQYPWIKPTPWSIDSCDHRRKVPLPEPNRILDYDKLLCLVLDVYQPTKVDLADEMCQSGRFDSIGKRIS